MTCGALLVEESELAGGEGRSAEREGKRTAFLKVVERRRKWKRCRGGKREDGKGRKGKMEGRKEGKEEREEKVEERRGRE